MSDNYDNSGRCMCIDSAGQCAATAFPPDYLCDYCKRLSCTLPTPDKLTYPHGTAPE